VNGFVTEQITQSVAQMDTLMEAGARVIKLYQGQKFAIQNNKHNVLLLLQ
jgi:hypothetical protein